MRKDFTRYVDSYYNKPREWISTHKVKDFLLKYYAEKGYCFPDLHVNKENRNHDETLYCFNVLNDTDSEKVLYHFYHFYSLSKMIYEKLSESLPESTIETFYHESKEKLQESFSVTIFIF